MMEGRFRKGKKAYGKNFLTPRQAKFKGRYKSFLIRRHYNTAMAGKMLMSAMCAMIGASQVALIQSQPIFEPAGILAVRDAEAKEKAKSIVETVINTAQSISSIFNEPIMPPIV